MAAVAAPDARALTQKLWSACRVLRDDGLTYSDYLEQLTGLLFLKMAHERGQALPDGLDWQSIARRRGRDLHGHYGGLLDELGRHGGALGLIFAGARNRIRDPARLEHLVHEVLAARTWSGSDGDLAGDLYEDLLARTAAEGKAGAGQYFTPRALVSAMVDCVQPRPGWTMADPACGTGGFLLACHERTAGPLRGTELVEATARLCAMNLFLHGVDAAGALEVGDALEREPASDVDLVLANPPFGVAGAEAQERRPGPWAATGSKQLAFLQHIAAMLRDGGQAAVVLPDNVLFEGADHGSAGATIRERLLETCDVHTILRLPTGVFYAPGVKANVVFFTRGAATRDVWVYDLRTGRRVTQKTRPLTRPDLDAFVDAYRDRGESERFRRWSIDEVRRRPGHSLDLWARVADAAATDPALLPAPHVAAAGLAQRLDAAGTRAAALARRPRARAAGGWTQATLGDLVEVVRGVAYARGQDAPQPAPGLVPLLRHTNLQRSWRLDDLKHVPAELVRDRQLVRAGDVVITSSGSREHLARALPATAEVEGFAVGAFLMILRPQEVLHPGYLGLYLRRPDVRRRLAQSASGTTLCNLRVSAVRALPVAVAPRDEQDRIVADLEAALAEIELLRSAADDAQRSVAELETSALHAAFDQAA